VLKWLELSQWTMMLLRGSKQRFAEKEAAAADQAFALGFSCEVTSSSRASDNNYTGKET